MHRGFWEDYCTEVTFIQGLEKFISYWTIHINDNQATDSFLKEDVATLISEWESALANNDRSICGEDR